MSDNANEVANAKHYWRTHHFQSARLVDGQPHRLELSQHISSLAPHNGSVLEFGCSSGRNLATLRQLRPDLALTGIDMNEVTVGVGRDANPDITFVLGDESVLDAQPTHDVVFTCSVLDHIPDPYWRNVYDELVRVAKCAVVLLEPVVFEVRGVLGGEPVGRFVEMDFADSNILAAPFSYAHNYYAHDPLLRTVRPLPITNAGQWQRFGNCYRLLERIK